MVYEGACIATWLKKMPASCDVNSHHIPMLCSAASPELGHFCKLSQVLVLLQDHMTAAACCAGRSLGLALFANHVSHKGYGDHYVHLSHAALGCPHPLFLTCQAVAATDSTVMPNMIAEYV